MSSPRQVISEFIERGYIKPNSINEALIYTEISPKIESWYKFMDRLLLILGGLALGFALLYFIAYNWNEFGRFAKFALIECCLVAAFFIYSRAQENNLQAQLGLMLCCFLVGILMAFFGQTYQTGADPWTLFFYWALLITPWVIVARFSALWLSWLALINIALILYIDSFGSALAHFTSAKDEQFIALFLLNSFALMFLELNSRRFTYLAPRWLARIIASCAGFIITLAFIENITSYKQSNPLPAILWAMFIVGIYVVYRHQRKDLFMLAGGCLASIVIIITFCIQEFSENASEGFLLVIAFLIIGLTSLATVWLKKIHKEMLT